MTSYLEHRRALKLGQVEPEKKKPRKKIKPFSDKRAKLNRQYSKESKPLWEGQECAIKSPGCLGMASGMHHVEGKDTPEKLLNKEEMIPACSYCNLIWVEENHAEAEKLGFKKSRMKTKRFDK